MFRQHKYPILEFDDSPVAKINPLMVSQSHDRLSTDRLVITFFAEVMKELEADGRILPEAYIGGENPFTVYRFADDDALIVLGQVGCPACGGNLDLLNAMGASRVMFCGGGGVLDSSIDVGQILVVDGAIRDEGFSYHYVEPSRCIYTDPAVTGKIADRLEQKGVPHLRGLVWTTDALFRETADRIAQRRSEGAKIVEMEQAGCIAVAKFRGFKYGALIYGGDDVSGSEWDQRSWRSRKGIRYDLVMLCKEITSVI